MVFATVFTGLAALWHFIKRSYITEIMERTPRFTLKSLGTAIRERLPSWLDFDLDTILRLAGEDITSETFIAILVLAIGISLCAGIVLYLLGVIEFKTILIIPLIFGGVCFAVIIPNANHNRKIVRVRLMEFIVP